LIFSDSAGLLGKTFHNMQDTKTPQKQKRRQMHGRNGEHGTRVLAVRAAAFTPKAPFPKELSA